VRGAGAAAFLLLGACGEGGDEDDCRVTWDNYGEGFFVGYCQTCHAEGSPNRHDAPEAVTFGTEADARRWAGAIRAAVLADPPTMPPGGGLTEGELDLLDAFLACDAAADDR
jgi:hypothetical protein